MPDDPISNVPKIFDLLVVLEQRMQRIQEGFEMLTKEQQALRNGQHETNKQMEEGFAAVTQQQQALSERVENGLAAEARERQALSNKFDEFTKWVVKETGENVSILVNMIEKNHQEFLTFRNQSLKFQSDMLKFQNDMLKFQSDSQKFQSDSQKFQSDSQKFQSDSQKFQSDMLKFRENTESFQQAVLVFQEVMRGNFISQRRSLDKNEQKSISQEEMLKRVLKNIEELKEESTAFEQRLARLEAA